MFDLKDIQGRKTIPCELTVRKKGGKNYKSGNIGQMPVKMS